MHCSVPIIGYWLPHLALWMLRYWYRSLICHGDPPLWSWDQRWSDSDHWDINWETQHLHAQNQPSFLSCGPSVKQRLQTSRVRSIVIALWGNLVCLLWISSIVRTKISTPKSITFRTKAYLLESPLNVAVHYNNVMHSVGFCPERSQSLLSTIILTLTI